MTANGSIFLSHLIVVIFFSYIARRYGQIALMTSIVIQSLMANIFVLKQMDLFGYTVTCSDVYSVGAILTLNILQEDHGPKKAQEAVGMSFCFLLFFAVMAWIHLLYVPSIEDTTHESYMVIFGHSFRLIGASIITTLIAQALDVRLFGFLRRYFPSTKLACRSGISTLVSQGIDTILFTFLGLYGLVSSPWNIIVVSYAVKVAISCIMLAFSSSYPRS